MLKNVDKSIVLCYIEKDVRQKYILRNGEKLQNKVLKSKLLKKCLLLFFLLIYFVIVYIVLDYLNTTCLYLYFFGIPCPGCGMTRAFLSLIRLDFVGAARYNFLVYFMPYVFVYLFFDFKKARIHNLILLGIGILFFVNWINKLYVTFW